MPGLLGKAKASMINDSWYTTGKDDWATPRWLFAQLDAEFHFTLDPCASPAPRSGSAFPTTTPSTNS